LLHRQTTAPISEPLSPGQAAIWTGHSQMHQTHGLIRPSSIRPSDPADRQSPITAEAVPSPFRHSRHHWVGNSAMRLDQIRRDTEQSLLDCVAVRNQAPEEHI
jgi:hypothetical protein